MIIACVCKDEVVYIDPLNFGTWMKALTQLVQNT